MRLSTFETLYSIVVAILLIALLVPLTAGFYYLDNRKSLTFLPDNGISFYSKSLILATSFVILSMRLSPSIYLT